MQDADIMLYFILLHSPPLFSLVFIISQSYFHSPIPSSGSGCSFRNLGPNNKGPVPKLSFKRCLFDIIKFLQMNELVFFNKEIYFFWLLQIRAPNNIQFGRLSCFLHNPTVGYSILKNFMTLTPTLENFSENSLITIKSMTEIRQKWMKSLSRR